MRPSHLLPLAAMTSAMVLPDQDITNKLIIESEKDLSPFSELPSPKDVFDRIRNTVTDAVKVSENALDDALGLVAETGSIAKGRFECLKSMTAFDAQAWKETEIGMNAFSSIQGALPDFTTQEMAFPLDHQKPNQTVYQLIANSKYTTKLAELINDDEDLVKALNSSAANYTVFAPIDAAFEKIPDHAKKPSKETIKKILLYHVSEDFYPAGRVLVSHTIPSLLQESALGDNAQRLRVGLTLRGLTANFYSRIIAINIFGTNGVIHGVDSLILPPPDALKIVDLLPGEFSTLQLALLKTGLFEVIEDGPHKGGTLFAPSNGAFQKLGPKINAFLFSKYGQKYLKAILKYHVVANETLYSDAFYKPKSANVEGVPKGYFHVDLPTLLEDRHLSVDVARYGGFINIKINGYTDVSIQDGIAKDGVIQVVSNVLIPPKHVSGASTKNDGGHMCVEELKARLAPFVEEPDDQEQEEEEQQQEL